VQTLLIRQRKKVKCYCLYTPEWSQGFAFFYCGIQWHMWHWMWRWWPCGNRSVANNVVGKYIYAKGNQMSMINPREVYMRVAKCVKLTRVLTSGYNTGNIKMKWVTLSHGRLWHQGHRASHQNLVIKKFCKNYQQSARIFTPLTLISFHRISSW